MKKLLLLPLFFLASCSIESSSIKEPITTSDLLVSKCFSLGENKIKVLEYHEPNTFTIAIINANNNYAGKHLLFIKPDELSYFLQISCMIFGEENTLTNEE